MTVKEYLNTFNNMVKNHPEIENLDICYSVDDEGNYFHPVNFTPTVGIKDVDDFDSLKKVEDWKNANAVCIN